MTMIASALAYSSFFAIPSVLLAVVGVFTLVAGPSHDRHGRAAPRPGDACAGDAALRGSLVRLEQHAVAG